MATTLFTTDVDVVYDLENNGNDSIGSRNLTEVNTPTYGTTSPPQGSYYADLDATTDEHYTLSDDDIFDPGSADYSLAFWMYPNTTSGPIIAAKGGLFDSNGWTLYADWAGSNFQLNQRHRSSGNTGNCYCGWSMGTGAWYHVVLSYDYSANQTTWWISNTTTFGSELNANIVTQSWPASANASTLYIGSRDTTNTMDGRLDEFAWFKGKALTAAEAEEIYKGTASGGWRAGGTTAPTGQIHGCLYGPLGGVI